MKRRIVFRLFLFLFVGFSLISCKYFQGPAGSDGQPKISNVIVDLLINGTDPKTGVRYVNASGNINLNWTVITETGVSSYELSKDGGTTVHVPGLSTNFYSGDTSTFFPESGSPYHIAVRSIDGDGKVGEWSVARTLIVDLTNPPTPGACTLNNDSASGINAGLTWSQADDAGSGINYYKLTLSDGTNTAIYHIYGTFNTLFNTPVRIQDNLNIVSSVSIDTGLALKISFNAANTYSGSMEAYDHAGRVSGSCSISGTSILSD